MPVDILVAPPEGGPVADGPAAGSYEILRQHHLHDMRAAMPAALARLAWSAGQLEAERTRRLRDLLQVAKERSAWHRKRLQHIEAQTVTEAQLETIAPMTKDDVMEHFDEIVTDPRLSLDRVESHLGTLASDAYLLNRYHVNASGGSSGRRSVVVHDWQGWVEGYTGFARHLERHMGPPTPGQPWIGAVVAADDPGHASSALPQTFSDPAVATRHRFPVTLPFGEIVGGLNRMLPDLMVGYPSMLHQLPFAARAGALQVAPKLIVSTSELLLPEIREAIDATWPARLVNFWASTEAAVLAVSCGVGRGMHLSDDLVVVEPVDRAGARVAPGGRAAKVYLTNLYNPTPLPLIRYEITDEVTLLEGACRCGSGHRRIGDILGRLEDSFVFPGPVTVHPVVFLTRLDKERHVVEYQVRQTPNGAALALRCDGDVDFVRLREQLGRGLRRLGVPDASIEITRVEQIERQKSGKLKRFVSLAAASAKSG